MSTTRQPGYYRVKYKGEWVIAEWIGNYWRFPGGHSWGFDEDISEIHPTPLDPQPVAGGFGKPLGGKMMDVLNETISQQVAGEKERGITIEDQDELWSKASTIIVHGYVRLRPEKEVIAELKKKYTLTKKH